ncbi:MAG: phosphonopyruvate decarboxylase-related protein, partial [Dehalococcoidia bacterium]|nr:phosphonopyruvate decarboxylase-related protein [Dehalococcoidia bacterium]
MANFQLMRELSVQTPSKIVMYIIDGLGGLPGPEGASELECANLPNLDRLAAESTCGLIQHVAPGITPGSGPGHLSLFGYDPLEYDIGRGILEALGLDMEVRGGDMCARGNFCTVDSDGILIGRRGGSNPVERLATETNVSLARLLSDVSIPGLTFEIKSGQEHRFAVVFRAANLEDDLTDTDPQHEGVPPRSVDAKSSKAGKTAEMVNRFIALARERLKDRDRANMIMLRGFSKQPPLPQFGDIYKLKAAAIASYPMYRGLSKLLGMEVATTGSNLAAQAQTLAERYSEYDFFFFHFKKADAAGEDGNFE